MGKGLQVVLNDREYAEVQQAARRSRLTTGEWVRRALRTMLRAERRSDTKRKLRVIRAAVEHDFPTAGIDRMLAEIGTRE